MTHDIRIPLDAYFSTLTDPQRRAVLAWARDHDWGGEPARWAYKEPGKLEASCIEWDGSGYSICRASFDTFRELRNWAGY